MNAVLDAWHALQAGGLQHIVDAVIAITLLEGAVLWLYHRGTGRGVAPHSYAVNMLAGLALMAALRCVVAGAAVHWTLLSLLLAGAAHATDIALRWRRGALPAATPSIEPAHRLRRRPA